MPKTDKEVYEQLIAEKSKNYRVIITILVFLLLLFVVATIVLSVLYVNQGSIGKETSIDIQTQGGDIKESNISSPNSTISGTIQTKNNDTVLICAIICGTVILIGGAVCLLRFLKK